MIAEVHATLPPVVHLREVDVLTAPDVEIFDHAADHGLVVVPADSGFPMLLAIRDLPIR